MPELPLTVFKKILNYTGIIFLVLTVVTGLFFLLPYHDFQLHLAQGDHGNNLYAFKKTMDGWRPYHDFWWVYGPLMLYYYALFMRFLGVNMHSVLIGYIFLQFLCGIVLYLILKKVSVKPYMAWMGAGWWWIFSSPFEHTYNHAGGILAILVTVYLLFSYREQPKKAYLYLGLGVIFLLCFIKLNFGFSMLAGFVIGAGLIDSFHKRKIDKDKKRFYLAALVVLPAAVFFIHWLMLRGLPFYAVRQCFPFLEGDQPYQSPFLKSLQEFWSYTATQMTRRHLVGITMILAFCIGTLAAGFHEKSKRVLLKKELGQVLLIVFIFFILNLHEFLASAVVYRSFWAEPFQIIAMFVIISFAFRDLPRGLKAVICLIIMYLVLNYHFVRINFVRPVKQFIPLERGQIYIANQPPWLNTVVETTHYLKEHLNPDETFLALVDDPLYYFLTDKDSPYRLTSFSEHIKVREDQEQELIRALERENVRYVILSNRYKSPETGLGTFGETYCQVLSHYLRDRYQIVAKFGEWDKIPEWFAHHGIAVLKKK